MPTFKKRNTNRGVFTANSLNKTYQKQNIEVVTSGKTLGRSLKFAPYQGCWGERSCPTSATAIHSVVMRRTASLTIERRTLHHRAIAAPLTNIRFNAYNFSTAARVPYAMCSPQSRAFFYFWQRLRAGNIIICWSAGADPQGRYRPPKIYESNFIRHDFVQIGKQHSRHKVILPSIDLPEQCCEVYFISSTVVNP